MTDLVGLASGLGGGLLVVLVKEARATQKERKREKEKQANTSLDRDKYTDDQFRQLFETTKAAFEVRISELETSVGSLKAELKTEKEMRKLAEVFTDAAEVRADDAERKLRHLQADFEIAQLSLKRLTRECGEASALAEARGRQIAELAALNSDLERRMQGLMSDLREARKTS